MASSYDRDVYSRYFARLLNHALKQGGGDSQAALRWLDQRYRLVLALFFSRHRREMSDAYMDVREHIVKRIKESEGSKEPEKEEERKETGA